MALVRYRATRPLDCVLMTLPVVEPAPVPVEAPVAVTLVPVPPPVLDPVLVCAVPVVAPSAARAAVPVEVPDQPDAPLEPVGLLVPVPAFVPPAEVPLVPVPVPVVVP